VGNSEYGQQVSSGFMTWCTGAEFFNVQRRTVHEALTRLMRPSRLYDLYAFSTNLPNGRDPRMRLRAEYMRMISATTIGTDTSAGDSNIRSEWRLSDVNANYNVCPTYPSLLVMPASFRLPF
jgi:myotubularin-related protein 1/2